MPGLTEILGRNSLSVISKLRAIFISFIPFIFSLPVITFNRLLRSATSQSISNTNNTTQSISNTNNTVPTILSSSGDLVSLTQSDRSILLTINYSSLELGNLQPPSTPVTSYIDGQPNWKRIGKIMHTVGLGSLGALITLLVKSPDSAATHRTIYTTYLIMICLGIITSVGLTFFSVLMEDSPVVGWVQIRLIYFSLSFVGLACFLHVYLSLPLTDIGFGMVPTLIGIVIIALYLFFGSKTNETRVERERS